MGWLGCRGAGFVIVAGELYVSVFFSVLTEAVWLGDENLEFSESFKSLLNCSKSPKVDPGTP